MLADVFLNDFFSALAGSVTLASSALTGSATFDASALLARLLSLHLLQIWEFLMLK
jgi:hypothetical protein